MTYYDVLGVPSTAAPSAIRRAYVGLARLHHPDFHTTDGPATRAAAEREMQRINEAWLVLGDETRRREYDSSLRTGSVDAATAAPAEGGWVPGSGTAHPDFVPYDDGSGDPDDIDWRELDDDEREAYLAGLDDTPIGRARPMPRWQQLLPVGLLFGALFCLSVGLVVNLPALLGLGIILFVLSGIAFLLTPMLAVMRTYERDPER